MARILAILDPGHFHAALPLRRPNPGLDPVVPVYAPDGPDLRRFLALVARFNDQGAGWRIYWRPCDDPLAALLADGRAEVAVLAGRNRGKLRRIRALVEAGVHVLADKPWVVEPADLADLEAIAGSAAHWSDLMTERHEPWARLFDRLAACRELCGDPAGDELALVLESVHHLAKSVDGVPLVRPAWYFDTGEQGEGLVDVTTHLVDRALLLAGGCDPVLHAARRWATAVGEEDFRAITGAGFPPALAGRLRDGVLPLMANGELEFSCRGLRARVRAQWRLRSPDGDAHRASFQGAHCRIDLAGDGRGCRLEVRGTPGDSDLADLARQVAAANGATVGEEDGALRLAPLDRSGHEEHFARVLDGFLAGLEAPPDAGDRTLALARYRLLAAALIRARAAGPPCAA
jgi:predicted dehydrogenase